MSGEQWGEAVDAGTLALMMCLYGEDLAGSATGDMWDDEHRMHREQVADVIRAAAPLIVADTRRKVAEERERDEALCRAVEHELIIAMLQRRISPMDDRKFKHGAEWALAQIRGKHAAIARGSGNGGTA